MFTLRSSFKHKSEHSVTHQSFNVTTLITYLFFSFSLRFEKDPMMDSKENDSDSDSSAIISSEEEEDLTAVYSVPLTGTDISTKIEDFKSFPIEGSIGNSDFDIPNSSLKTQGYDMVQRISSNSEDDKQVKRGKQQPTKRKIVKRLSKPSIGKDPKEKLIEDLMDHLGLVGDRLFTSMLKEEKYAAGSRLLNLLEEVTGGAILPLLDFTLKRDDVKKLANLKGLRSKELPANTCSCVKEEEEDVHDRISAAVADMKRTMDEKISAAVADMKRTMQGASGLTNHGVDDIVMEVNSPSSTEVLPSTAPLICSVCGDSALIGSPDPPACHTCINFFKMGFRGICRKGGKCEVTTATRAKCTACRYDKCMSAGMAPASRKRKADQPPIEDVSAPKLCVSNDGAGKEKIDEAWKEVRKSPYVIDSGMKIDQVSQCCTAASTYSDLSTVEQHKLTCSICLRLVVELVDKRNRILAKTPKTKEASPRKPKFWPNQNFSQKTLYPFWPKFSEYFHQIESQNMGFWPKHPHLAKKVFQPNRQKWT